MLDAVAAAPTGRARVASGAIFSDVPARPVVITSVTRAAATGRGGGSSDDESDDDALGLASLGSGDPTPAGLAILCVILVVVLCAGAACFYVECVVSGEGDDKVDEEAPSEKKQVEDEKEAPEDAPAPRPVRRGSGLDVDGVRVAPPREDPTRTRLTFTFKAHQLGIAFCPDGTAGMLQPGSEAEAKKFGSARPAPKSSRETS